MLLAGCPLPQSPALVSSLDNLTRCLMPARGWYEWNEKELVRSDSGRQVKQPYYICAPNAEAIAFAGLWAVWTGRQPGAFLHLALQGGSARHRSCP